MVKIKVNEREWFDKAQAGELSFHIKDTFRPSGGLDRETVSLFDEFGFNQKEYDGKVVIDAGCGSMLRTKYFKGADIIAIDPLASEFAKIHWSDLRKAKLVYSVPLEENLPSLTAKADLVISINVLDHCFDFEMCMFNMKQYMKPDGLCFVSFDTHKNGIGLDDMHPLDLDERTCEQVFSDVGFRVEKKGRRSPYGGGDQALNYWLRGRFV